MDASTDQRTAQRILAAVLLFHFILASIGVANAGIHRNFASRFSVNAPGDIQIVGNTLLSCSTQQGPNRQFCDDARRGEDGRNNQFYMDHVDLDTNSFTFNSSAAGLAIPTDADVIWAGLYWGARLSAGKFGGIAGTDFEQAETVLFSTGHDSYKEINAQQLDRFATSYSAFADVTGLVKTQAAGSTVQYWTANVHAGTGGNRHAGWALVVVVRDAAQPLRNLTVFDGYADVRKDRNVAMNITGFATPFDGDFGIRIGSVTYDGDASIAGDRIEINGTDLIDPDSQDSSPNFFDAGIGRLDERISDKQPDFINQLGVDIDIFDATDRIENGASTANVTFVSNGDIYYPAVLTFAAEVFHPTLTQQFITSVEDKNGGDPLPGEILQYTMSFENSGDDPATGVILTAPIPMGTNYEPGSLQVLRDDAQPANVGPVTDLAGDDLAEFDGEQVIFRLGKLTHPGFPNADDPGQGAAVSFAVRVRADAGPFPATVSNQANVDYQSLSTRDALTATSNVAGLEILEPPKAQIGVASEVLSPGPLDNLDGTHTFTEKIVVKNHGETDLSKVALEQDLAATFSDANIAVGPVSVTSTTDTLRADPAYTGIPPHTNLLDPASKLPVGASGTLTVELTVTPDDNPGPYKITATGAGTTFFDLTYKGDNQPTLITFNSPPQANDDSYTVRFGDTLEVDVLTNDSDSDGDALSIESFETVSPAAHGSLVDSGGGKFVYQAPLTEPADFDGTYEFSYVIADPAGQAATATAVFTVPTAETDLGVDVATEPNPVQPGDTVVITITAQNFGDQAAEPRIVGSLPDGFAFESATASQGTFSAESGQWEIGTLPAATAKRPTAASLAINATVKEIGSYTASATISADKLDDPKPKNDEVSFTSKVLMPAIAVVKNRVRNPVANGDGSFNLSYDIVIKNTGKVELAELQMESALGTAFADVENFSVVGVTGDFSINPDFDGSENIQLLAGTDTLPPGRTGKIAMEISVTPGDNPGPYTNSVAVFAKSATGVAVSHKATFTEIVFAQKLAVRG